MSRLVVAGIGTPTFVDAERHFGPGRRTAHFAFALADAGHEVTVLWRRDDASVPTGALESRATPRGSVFRAQALPGAAFRDGRVAKIVGEATPDAVVAASVHASAELAHLLPSHVPLWADVFGDPMAEAQAKAHAEGSDASLASFWDLFSLVLARGDCFSAVSNAQANALVGQLGLAGRLTGESAGDALVSVVPCACEATSAPAAPWLRGHVVPDDAFVALFSGSFNTWCDVETMLGGVERAMDLEPSLHFVATGGAVPGHYERGAEAVAAAAARSRHRSRFHLLGWISPTKLAALMTESDVGLNVEKSLYERRLGAENRVTEWLAYGLPAITSAQSELGRTLAERDLAFAIKPGDADDLCRTLIYLALDRSRVEATGKACLEYAARRTGYATTAGPLISWCARPVSTSTVSARPRLAMVSDPRTLSRLTEQYLATLGPLELGYRSARWMWRRVARAWNDRRAT